MRHSRSLTLCLLVLAALSASFALPPNSYAQEDIEKLEKTRAPRPKEFALVFSNGYAGDTMPKDDERFETLLKKLKGGGFNVLLSTYTPKRLELCQKHGVFMMVDLLEPEHHVYKSPEKAKVLCEKLRNHPAVWGYNIWNDPMRKTGAGRRRDVNNVRRWDPTHPAYCGTYRVEGMNHLKNADILGYYDFHWKRGTDQHFPHLSSYLTWARERDAWFYSWLSATSGIAGKGNFNRSLYSANTALAFGQKGFLWFLGNDLMDAKTLEWTTGGNDILKVHRQIGPVLPHLFALGLPKAVYSTAITKTCNNDALAADKRDRMPPGLEKNAFPADFPLQPRQGEFVMGVYESKATYGYLANHNAYASQDVILAIPDGMTVRHFSRKDNAWHDLKAEGNAIRLHLEPGGGELIRMDAKK